jgi:Flp pilus assembly protein TadG
MTMLSEDRGSISIMAAIFFSAAMLVLALVVDGTGKMRALSKADAVAAEAARAALSAVDTRGTTVVIDTRSAAAAAREYLSQAGYPGSVDIGGPRTVRVTVSLNEPAKIGLLHARYHVTGTATAELGVGTRDNGGLP